MCLLCYFRNDSEAKASDASKGHLTDTKGTSSSRSEAATCRPYNVFFDVDMAESQSLPKPLLRTSEVHVSYQ